MVVMKDLDYYACLSGEWERKKVFSFSEEEVKRGLDNYRNVILWSDNHRNVFLWLDHYKSFFFPQNGCGLNSYE